MRLPGQINKSALFFILRAFALCAVSVWTSGPALAQRTVLTEPPTPLLPATLGKLTRAAEGDAGDGLGTLDTADLSAEGLPANARAVLAEDGMKRFAKSDYDQLPSNQPRATISVFSFHDASGAISAYDYLRRDGMRADKLGDESVVSSDQELLRSGINVVAITRSKLGRDETASVVKDLAEHLPKALGTTGISPLLPTLLPEKNLDPGSVKYALGPAGYAAMNGVLPADSLDFDKSGEAVTAKYRNGGTLTLALYPTPQIAGERTRAAQSALPSATVRREGPLVVIATGAWPAGAAHKIVENVHLRVDASFDKPMPLEFHTEIRKTYTLFQSIAIFCSLGALAAIVLGLFFGGGRALIRVLQGKPAYTEPEFLHIDLRGRSHRIRTGPQAGPEA
ncbi:MAG TPA: DUF6599 family protein [Acidobacteriaceae bacterium]